MQVKMEFWIFVVLSTVIFMSEGKSLSPPEMSHNSGNESNSLHPVPLRFYPFELTDQLVNSSSLSLQRWLRARALGVFSNFPVTNEVNEQRVNLESDEGASTEYPAQPTTPTEFNWEWDFSESPWSTTTTENPSTTQMKPPATIEIVALPQIPVKVKELKCHNCVSVSGSRKIEDCVPTNWIDSTVVGPVNKDFIPSCLMTRVERRMENGEKSVIISRGQIRSDPSDPLSMDICVDKSRLGHEITICTCTTDWCNSQQSLKADLILVLAIVISILSSGYLFFSLERL